MNSSIYIIFENKLLLGLIFMNKYPDNKIIANFFEVSEFIVLKKLDKSLSVFVE